MPLPPALLQKLAKRGLVQKGKSKIKFLSSVTKTTK